MVEDGWKVCTKCGIHKEATPENFSKDKRLPDGLRSECCECGRERRSLIVRSWQEEKRLLSLEQIHTVNQDLDGKKTCTKCGVRKDATKVYFYSNRNHIDGLQSACKECQLGQGREYLQKQREQDPEGVLKRARERVHKSYQKHADKRREGSREFVRKDRAENPEKYRESSKRYRKAHMGEVRERNARWRSRNKDKVREYGKRLREQNPDKWREWHRAYLRQYNKAVSRGEKGLLALLRRRVRARIRSCLRERGYRKTARTFAMIGCTVQELLDYLGPRPDSDSQIDHICPCAQAQNEEELLKLQHYTNLRWLSPLANCIKKHHKTPEGEELCRKLLGREWIDSVSSKHN